MARKVTYAIDCAFNFRILAFATGAYNCTCSICGIKFIGDKRAVQCLECAIKLVEEKLTSTNTTKATICNKNGECNFRRRIEILICDAAESECKL